MSASHDALGEEFGFAGLEVDGAGEELACFFLEIEVGGRLEIDEILVPDRAQGPASFGSTCRPGLHCGDGGEEIRIG